MEYDNEGDINYEAWFKKNRQYIPTEFQKTMEKCIGSMRFLAIYMKSMRKLKPALQKLMYQQYPVFKTEKRPLVVDYINTTASTTGYTLLCKLKNLVEGQQAGVNIREKYPDFQEWVEFYGRPHKPITIDEATRPQYTWLTNEQWELYRDKENAALLQIFNWKEKRKFEFIDVVQTIILNYYKELEELNADEWIIYAVHIVDEYDYYLTSCEHIELFIDCGFPEEDMKLTDAEFFENFRNLSKEIHDETTKLRNRRIAGEAI